MNTKKLPTYFISHGGGPWPWMPQTRKDFYEKLEASLKAIPQDIEQIPKAILMVSAHWEEKQFTVQGHPKPGMIYDYYGFPEHTYHVSYPSPGFPSLAKRIYELINDSGFSCAIDSARGYDHGMFSPMAIIYPHANIPVIQLSLTSDLNPDLHFLVGRSLSALRNEGILIIGSGLSYHNLAVFNPEAYEPSKQFDDWLQQTITNVSPTERYHRLLDWSEAPYARFAHPREEHLLPLMVAVGAAEQEKGVCIYREEDFMGGIVVSSFCIGGPLPHPTTCSGF